MPAVHSNLTGRVAKQDLRIMKLTLSYLQILNVKNDCCQKDK